MDKPPFDLDAFYQEHAISPKAPNGADPIPALPDDVSAFPINPADIPPRDWIVPGLMMRRHLSVLVAPPASGKSLLTLQLAITIALGLSWGGWIARKPETVIVINVEDDHAEMRRRLAVAAEEMGADQAELVDRIRLMNDAEGLVVTKFDQRTKAVTRTPVVGQLVERVLARGAGVVIADPFSETFEGEEDNTAMKWAAVAWREVARQSMSSVMLVHHTKKYSNSAEMAGNIDAARGGGALVGTARIMSTLYSMTKEEAEVFDISEREQSLYLRHDDAKNNYAIPGQATKWFKKKTVAFDNGRDNVPGDDVGVLVPWSPPSAFEGLSVETVNKALDVIDAGLIDENGRSTGQRYTISDKGGERWVVPVIQAWFGCGGGRAKSIARTWLENGLLVVEDYHDPAVRKHRQGLKVVNTKRPGGAPTPI
jgi:hypothetical protein